MTTSYEFYSKTYFGKRTEAEITPFLKIADIDVENALVNRELSADEENSCRYASCLQADEYALLDSYGFSDGINGYSSVKLGDFSISRSGSSSSVPSDGGDIDSGRLCERAAAYLERHGLLYRGGVGV